MSRIRQHLIDLFAQGLQRAWPELTVDTSAISITQATKLEFGDYQCNAAMRLGKLVKLAPREMAARWLQVMQEMPQVNAYCAKLEVAGPGFINITLDDAVITAALSGVWLDAKAGVSMPEQQERVVVDFSSPNIAKEMHVGHLRSTVIGDSLARILQCLGNDVLRLNHVGDWGTAFGMLIAYLQEAQPQVLSAEVEASLPDLMQWYRLSKQRFDADAEFKKRAQQAVVRLQAGEAAEIAAWRLICAISRASYQEIYDILQVDLVERGESYYNDMLEPTLQRLHSAGLLEQSDGADCIFLDGFVNRDGDALPLMVRKSDGGFNYASTDLAALWHRLNQEKADRIIYVTDAGQALHFKMLFAAAQAAGWLDAKVEVMHVAFGLVLGADGKKFRTRSGDTEKLIDLLQEAMTRATAIMQQRHPEWSEQECKEAGSKLGIAAVKYSDLSTSRTSDYVFSYDKMLSFEGNTAAFLLYAYVRTQSILRKLSSAVSALDASASIVLQDPAERLLALHLARFDDVLHQVSISLMPHHLCEYLFHLAENFHAFFHACRVEGSEQQSSRILLCQSTANILALGLQLLGIPLLQRM